MSLSCFGSVDKPEQGQEIPPLEGLQGPRLSMTVQALDHWGGSVLQRSSRLLTVISEGDVVQPAVSAGRPHSLWENRRTWGGVKSTCFSSPDPHGVKTHTWSQRPRVMPVTKQHPRSSWPPAPSPPAQLSPAQEVPNCQATGMRDTHFPWSNSSRPLCVWGLNNNSLTVKLGERDHELPAGARPVGSTFEHWLVIKFAYQTLSSKSPIKPRQIGNS